MAGKASLVLESSTRFRDREAVYVFSFYSDHFSVTSDELAEEIGYSDIRRIRSGESRMKILLKSGEVIRIPCSIGDMRQIKTVFRVSSSTDQEIAGSALVEFGELCFFVSIESTSLKELKSNVIKRVGRHFYPALDQESISLEMFSRFVLLVRNSGRETEIESNEDLRAALRYFGGSIDLVIRECAGS